MVSAELNTLFTLLLHCNNECMEVDTKILGAKEDGIQRIISKR